ncbi:class I SAM-dependent methyltransferase [Thermoproteota archaeon]
MAIDIADKSQKNLELEFNKRGIWLTKFTIDGVEYGGKFDPSAEKCIKLFFDYFPNAKRILELGSLEGGHTFTLASHSGVSQVIGIEGRKDNMERARFVQKLLGIHNVDFVEANLEKVDLSRFGRFDVVFCVGILYHMPEPWLLLEQIGHVSKNLFIRTHYVDSQKSDEAVEGYEGIFYEEKGLKDSLGGLSTKSFWPSLDSLTKMLTRHGFEIFNIIYNETNHPNGPRLTAVASSKKLTA